MSGEHDVDFRFLTENSVDIICSVGLDRVIHSVSPSSVHIDHFKEFNDQYGYQLGDDCLRAIAAVVKGFPEGRGWVTASIGAATTLARSDGTMRVPESLLLAADNALYKAKRGEGYLAQRFNSCLRAAHEVKAQ